MTSPVKFSVAALEPKPLWGMISIFMGHDFRHISKSWHSFLYSRFFEFCQQNASLVEYTTLPNVQAHPDGSYARMLAIYRAILVRSQEAVNKKIPRESDCATLDPTAVADGMRLGKIRGAINTFHPSQWVELARFTKEMEEKWHPVIQARPATPPALVLDEKEEEEEVVATLATSTSPFRPTAPLSLANAQNGWFRQASSSSGGISDSGAASASQEDLKKFNSSLDLNLSSPGHVQEKPKEPSCLQSFYNWCSSWCSYFKDQATRFFNWILLQI